MSNELTTALIEPTTPMLSETLHSIAGLAQSCYLDPNPMDLALNQSKPLPRPGDVSVTNFSVSNTPPSATDVDTKGNTITMSNHKSVSFHLTGEEEAALKRNASSFVAEQTSAAVEECVQEVENAVRNLLDTKCGYGVTVSSGSNPFDSTAKLDVFGACRATFNAAGAKRQRSYIFGPAASQRYLNLDSVNRIDAGDDIDLRREGTLGREFGFALRETPDSASVTNSNATGYQTAATASKGDTTLTVDTGTNDFQEGDILSIDGANYKYVVSSFESTSGTITLQAPLLEAIGNNASITVANKNASHDRDFCLGPHAVFLSIRPDHISENDFRTDDTAIITDPITGISMRLSAVPGYGLTQYFITFVYGLQIYVPEESIAVYDN